VVFEGNVVLGDGVEIGPTATFKNLQCSGNNTIIKKQSLLEESQIGEACDIDHFALNVGHATCLIKRRLVNVC